MEEEISTKTEDSTENIIFRSPRTAEDFEAYYSLRWEILRKPQYKCRGSERDPADDSAHHIMAVTSDGKTVGVGRIHIREDDVAQIRYMAVHPDFEGKGIGRKIIAALEQQICSLHQSCEIEINSRDTAVPFYEKCGYKQIGPGQRLWGIIPHTMMGKTISCAV